MKLNNPVSFSLAFVALSIVLLGTRTQSQLPIPISHNLSIKAITKTNDVETSGDSADDSCTYVNQKDPTKSLVISTNKKLGLEVYDLSGNRLQTFPDGDLDNVDIRYNFQLGGEKVALISAGNKTKNTIDFYYVDEDTNSVKRLSSGAIDAGISVYGSCMYKSPITQKMYVFVNSKLGEVIQWEVRSDLDGALQLSKAREFTVGSKTEGCVADEDYRKFYIGEERVGIWRYDAEPNESAERKMIDKTGAGGHLVADVEGLTIYRLRNGEGYLLASSQGESAFNIYDRESGEFIGKFHVEYDGKPIEDTDGIDATSNYLGSRFPFGMLVVQDGNTKNRHQSFKYISWADVALKFSPPLKLGQTEPLLDKR